tara:strand:- start:712 stop:1509 length:798 start_codon:yes stop_codon:yes gene_type:complete
LNNPKNIFPLLESKKIHIPEWSMDKPKEPKKWLVKSINSAGGISVQKACLFDKKINEDFFYQKFSGGNNISIQFEVLNSEPKILLACNQWLYPIKNFPFLLGGIISTNLNFEIFLKIKRILKKLCELLDFNGLNSIDFLIKKNTPLVIDINPRPGLAINMLYRIYRNSLFKKKKYLINSKKFYCSSIVYSDKTIMFDKNKFKIVEDLSRSKNFSELPTKDCIIKNNQPICVVHSSSFSQTCARLRVEKLSKFILNKLTNKKNIND